nr:hypothetical protein [uncultured Rhodopila sp.]
MATPVNQSFFDDPRERDRQLTFAGGYNATGVRGGIWPITEDKLRPGEVIFRVGHSTMPMTKNMSSPWWMRDESFYAICDASERSGTGLPKLYRMKCAVAYDFGVADIVLEARVTALLRVFAGHGRPVVDESDGRRGQVWYGALEIAQMFIPGLRDFSTGFPTPICHQSIEILEKYKLSEFISVQRGRQRKISKRLLANL